MTNADGFDVAQTAQPDPGPGEIGEADLDTPQADEAERDNDTTADEDSPAGEDGE